MKSREYRIKVYYCGLLIRLSWFESKYSRKHIFDFPCLAYGVLNKQFKKHGGAPKHYGKVPERSNGPHCKCGASASEVRILPFPPILEKSWELKVRWCSIPVHVKVRVVYLMLWESLSQYGCRISEKPSTWLLRLKSQNNSNQDWLLSSVGRAQHF